MRFTRLAKSNVRKSVFASREVSLPRRVATIQRGARSSRRFIKKNSWRNARLSRGSGFFFSNSILRQESMCDDPFSPRCANTSRIHNRVEETHRAVGEERSARVNAAHRRRERFSFAYICFPLFFPGRATARESQPRHPRVTLVPF